MNEYTKELAVAKFGSFVQHCIALGVYASDELGLFLEHVSNVVCITALHGTKECFLS